MTLGIGSGAALNLRPYGLDRQRRVNSFISNLTQLDSLRRGEDASAVDADGEPLMRLSGSIHTDLWVAAHGPQALDIAARFADGWLPSGLAPGAYGERLHMLRERAALHGRDPNAIIPALYVWSALANERSESMALVAESLVRASALFRGPSGFAASGAEYPLIGEYVPTDMHMSTADEIVQAIPMEVAQRAILCGSLEEVSSRIAEYEEAGCRHLILGEIGRFISPQARVDARACITRLAAHWS
jgi:phthiodiolone/phenolphthiodiolone dimycocerosates ketoreductase